MVRTLAVTLLLGLPLMAIADTRTTFHCEGDQTTEGGIGETASTTKERVVQDYTLDLDVRRYWDWKEKLWRPIHSVEPHTLVLSEETVGPGLHGLVACLDRSRYRRMVGHMGRRPTHHHHQRSMQAGPISGAAAMRSVRNLRIDRPFSMAAESPRLCR
jgi:hypothetical protein